MTAARASDSESPSKRDARGFYEHIHLGNFSFDENRNYCDDDRCRKFFVDPGAARPDLDLLRGHKDFVDRGRGEFVDRGRGESVDCRCDGNDKVDIKSLDAVLKWIRDHAQELERKEIIQDVEGTRRLSADFVTRRGALHDIFQSVHFNSRYEFLVTLYRGTYYLEQIELLCHKENPNDPDGTQVYSGKKFAQFCTSSRGTKTDTDLPINDKASYEAVMTARCGDFRLIFSVEVHAEIRDRRWLPIALRQPRHLNYVNIRTTREFNGQAGIKPRNAFFRKKLFQFWSQNHIAGIPRIVLGWRDDDNHVITRVETYMTSDIPNISACPWKPPRYFTAMEKLLSQITQEVTTDDAGLVYHLVLERVEGGPYPILAQRLSERRFRVERRQVSRRILPDWFVAEVLREKAHPKIDETTEQ